MRFGITIGFVTLSVCLAATQDATKNTATKPASTGLGDNKLDANVFAPGFKIPTSPARCAEIISVMQERKSRGPPVRMAGSRRAADDGDHYFNRRAGGQDSGTGATGGTSGSKPPNPDSCATLNAMVQDFQKKAGGPNIGAKPTNPNSKPTGATPPVPPVGQSTRRSMEETDGPLNRRATPPTTDPTKPPKEKQSKPPQDPATCAAQLKKLKDAAPKTGSKTSDSQKAGSKTSDSKAPADPPTPPSRRRAIAVDEVSFTRRQATPKGGPKTSGTTTNTTPDPNACKELAAYKKANKSDGTTSNPADKVTSASADTKTAATRRSIKF